MTLKNSLLDRRMLSEKLRHTNWATALFTLLMFFAMPIATLLNIQEAAQRAERFAENVDADRINRAIEGITTTISANNIFVTIVIAAMAVVVSAGVFRYMHNRQQVDFYHSLPVSRSALFTANFISGIVSFLIAYFLNLAISLAIIACSPFREAITASAVFGGIGSHVLGFIAIYSISVLAQMIAGNSVTALLCTASIFAAPPALYGLSIVFRDTAYRTFSLPTNVSNKVFVHISPVVAYMFRFEGVGFNNIKIAIYWIIITAIVIAAAALLYNKRPSEAAGKAVAFKAPSVFIKYMVTLLASLCMGLLMETIGGNSYWMIFGVVCGAVISYCIIEAIYHFEFKKLFCHWKAMCVFTFIICVALTMQRMDFFGYDSFVPKLENIKAATIAMDDYADYLDAIGTGNFKTNVITDKEIIQSVLNLANAAVEGKDADYNGYSTRTMGFQTKFGRKIYRRYHMDPKLATEDVHKIFDSQEYKRGAYSIMNIDAMEQKSLEINFTRIGDAGLSSTLADPEATAKIAAALQEEIMLLTAEQAKKTLPIATISLSEYTNEMAEYRERTRADIYPQFTKTIALLKAENMMLEQPADPQLASLIEKVEISIDSENRIGFPYRYAGKTEEIKDCYTITNPQEIELLLRRAVPYHENTYNMLFVNDIHSVRLVFNSGSEMYLAFAEGDFPKELDAKMQAK